MSHFSVLVIGNNVEAQLQPFHEFECTGTNDQYIQDVDITEEVRGSMTGDEPISLEEALSDYGIADAVVQDESEVKKEGADAAHRYGYAIVKDGTLVKAVDRTNPNKRWDWWVVGGRWSGFLKLKPGAVGEQGERSWTNREKPKDAGRCDAALKGAIDFEGMRQEAGDRAAALWDKAHELTAGVTWEAWASVRARCASIEEARTFYKGQAAVQLLKKGDPDAFGWDLDDTLAGPKDAYIQAARDRAITTWAVVQDSQWHEKGSMGFFGMSSGDMQQADWNRRFNEIVDALPDDTPLTLVDCHI